ncbi:V-type ATP synthase subunit I [Candidatus Venteria ishoeyi]|uniref:V-type ATP synthase subunit I n=1 Tax=Candidatus Venteria ishoeyi TaxID=1899563 RepID=A0A1H6F8M9_9GAMM|nr:V-type ATPase 116kDa subunit family protein [Candidatus Venteria ishoeyi]SEH05669.1 V-type ATP synthase subunit I [Candidatus Venteria ishoeyi]
MSIVALHKITLCGLSIDREAMLADLQTLGLMHIIALQTPPAEREPSPFTPDEEAYKALHYLLDAKHKRRQITEPVDFDFGTVVSQTLENKQRRRDTEDRIAFLERHIEALTPWGDFTLPPLAELAGQRLWFYQVPHAQKTCFSTLDLPWQQVHRDNRYAYIVVIARDKPSHEVLPLPRSHTGYVPLHTLKRQLAQAEIKLEDIRDERNSLTHWIFLLSRNLAHAEDQTALHQVQQQTLERDGVCVVQGWAAQHDLKKLQAFTERHRLALLAETPDTKDKPPTLLDNPDQLSGGEALVGFYQTPGYNTWDPSRMVFFSFALFFAMILADAAYAVVLMLIVGYFWKSLGGSANKRRLRTLAVAVLGMSLFYGILVGSYFGWTPPPDSLPGMLKVLDLNNFDSMMQLSIGIGCLHLIASNAMMAWQRGAFPDNAIPIGWVAAIIGGFLWWQAWNLSGGLILGGGITLILLFGGNCKVNSMSSGLLAVLERLTELTNITKLFGDILSYLRLFALGLASSSLAVTFNQLADQVYDAVPGLGLLLAILILILGHSINLALGIISGFVHGLRLNFIEFFNWSISAEGYPFRPFAKKELEP